VSGEQEETEGLIGSAEVQEMAKTGRFMPTNFERIKNAVKSARGPGSFS
jgi:hypothetical protein